MPPMLTTTLSVTCMLRNARSLVNKLVESQNYINQHRPFIVGITETWGTDPISDAELNLYNYNIFHCDRMDGRGGGVILYVHTSLHANTCDPLTGLHIEDLIWCIVTGNECTKTRSPQSSDVNDNTLNTTL